MKIRCLVAAWLTLSSLTFSSLHADTATPVSAARVSMAPVYDEVPLTGSVSARRVSRISPLTGGSVTRMLVDEGDLIRTGDALLHLDPLLARIGLDRVRAQVMEARAILDEAERQRDEAAELVEKKHVSATNYAARIADVRIRAAILQRLQAELALQQEILDRHVIYAPFDGVITSKEVEVGQWVETGSALLELVEIAVLRVDVPVPQLYYSRISAATAVNIRFDALPGFSLDATVLTKIPSGDASTRTFPVRIEIRNDAARIAPGMSARVRLKLAESGDVMLLPRDAIVRKPDGSESVWLVADAGGQLQARALVVSSGRAYRDQVEVIADGLQAGDRVVVRGNEILREGQLLQVVQEYATDR